jgi:hypothetical protein
VILLVVILVYASKKPHVDFFCVFEIRHVGAIDVLEPELELLAVFAA